MADRGIVVTKVVALVVVPIGIVLLAIAGYTGHRQYTILKTWPSVDAEVTKSEVVQGHDDEGRALFGVDLEFRYTVNGQQFVTPSSSSIRSSSYKGTKERAATYAVGTRHPVQYNPMAPEDIRFDVGYNVGFFFVPLLLGGMGIVFTGLGIGLLYATRSEKPVLCPACGQEVARGQNSCPNCASQLPGSAQRAA